MSSYTTTNGQTALAAGPVNNLKFALGSDYGYVPNSTDSGVRGNIILQGEAGQPTIAGPSLYKYTIPVSSAQDINFGEIALLFPNGNLFLLKAYAEPISKTSNPDDLDGVGGSIDVYVNTSGVAEVDLNAGFQLGELTNIDNLPQTADARYKNYIVPHPKYPEIPISVFRSNYLWGISNYDVLAESTVNSGTISSVNITGSYILQEGDIVQFGSGSFSSNVRSVKSAATGDTVTSVSFTRPLTTQPTVGDKIYIFVPSEPALTSTNSDNGNSNVQNAPYLALSGERTMGGTLKMGNHRISTVAEPQFDSDAATRKFVIEQSKARVFIKNNVSGTQILDASLYDSFLLTLVGNVILTITGGDDDQKVLIKLKQDATGGRIVSLPATMRYPSSASTFAVTTDPNAVDRLGVVVDKQDSRYDLLAVAKNLK